MKSAQVGAVLGYVRQLAGARPDEDLADHQLLERFATHRDEAAFAVLLRRHGPMVLGVCRSVLQNLHDAEDAFQATFLVLARKADSIHRREAVSGWLHRVAYHLAVDAQASAARRRALEQRAVTMPPADPLLDLSLRELSRVLNEELQQLPQEYRAPLVLCCLEGKSLEEAARLLGWTRGAVKGRLQRGRGRLRERLRQRGLEFPLGLSATALALTSTSGQVSARLASSTLRAAVKVAVGQRLEASVVSAKVAALIQGVNPTMFPSKTKIAMVLLAALGIAAACGVMWHRASAAGPLGTPQRQAGKPKDRVSQTKPMAEETVEVRGRVLDPDGKPVAGAKLYLARSLGAITPGRPAPSRQTTTGPDGRFRFAVPKSELDKGSSMRTPEWPLQAMAVSPGHGCDWEMLGSGAKELTLRLVKDLPISGRILDPDGKAVAGAKITLTGISAPTRGLDSYLAVVRKGNWGSFAAKGWAGPLGGRPAVLTTTADGRFKLTGLGRERLVSFHVEGPSIATAYFEVMTRAAKTVTGARAKRVYGATFDYVGLASRPIRGLVHDKDTGKPLADARLRVLHPSGPLRETVTDKKGRYELVGLAKVSSYTFEVNPVNSLYFWRHVKVNDKPGLDVLSADIDMVQGLTVRGKVTDRAGKPVAGARVDYHPIYSNPNANTRLEGVWWPHSEATTGPDGSYALAVLPGQGVIGVAARSLEEFGPAHVSLRELKDFLKIALPFLSEETVPIAVGNNLTNMIGQSNYNALVLVNPGEKEKALVRNVVLKAPRQRQGRVVGPDGQPLKGVTVIGLHGPYEHETLKGAEFTVRRYNPRTKRQLVFLYKDKGLGFFLKELTGEPTEPLVVKLQRCGSVSGRIVDPDGQPVPRIRLQITGKTVGMLPSGTQRLFTDKQGRFQFKGLVPGEEYLIKQADSNFISAQAVVEPGKQKDLGDIKLAR